MITYEITIVCDGCKATFSTGENQLSPFTEVAVSSAWQNGWRFPHVEDADSPRRDYCPECARKRMLQQVSDWEQSVKDNPPQRVILSSAASKTNSAGPAAQGQPG